MIVDKSANRSIQLLLIDPQNDFCDSNGSLYVPGAEHDMQRVADLINNFGEYLDDIHVSLDSHYRMDISHGLWWVNQSGEHPEPFTMISSAEVETGKWTSVNKNFYSHSLAYLKSLEAAGRYPHTIWPEHCLIGHNGHNVFPKIAEAVYSWEGNGGLANFILKGNNPGTEHFSALRAEVPDEADVSTQLNQKLIHILDQADQILIAGQAATHCVLSTVIDLAEHLTNQNNLNKLIWLSDASSPVPNPPGSTVFSDKLISAKNALVAKGMQIMTVAELSEIFR